MTNWLGQLMKARWLTAIAVVVVIGGVGSVLLAPSHAQSPSNQQKTSTSLLRPYSLGTAPYQYVAYSGSLSSAQAATGVNQLIAAFIISSGSCEPAWGGAATNGLISPRSTVIAGDIAKVRAAGAEVTVSFGGSNGAELATTCSSVAELTKAYESVVDTYNLKQVDFDIEGATLASASGNALRAAAIRNVQHDRPNLKVWLTLPVHTKGLTAPGVALLQQLVDHGVVISGINIMAMNYNINSTDMGDQAIQATRASFKQLRTLYPNNSDAETWKALGITVMIGKNNTVPETFTLADAAQVKRFAADSGIGMVSMWNIGRDVACPAGNADPQPSISCSGVDQQPYAFLHSLTIPARN